MNDKKKIVRMMALISISFLFSYGWGMHIRHIEKQTAYVRRKSDYRYGLASLQAMAHSPKRHKELIDEFFRWLNGNELVQPT